MVVGDDCGGVLRGERTSLFSSPLSLSLRRSSRQWRPAAFLIYFAGGELYMGAAGAVTVDVSASSWRSLIMMAGRISGS
jgi:hypothetical protein